VKDETRVLRSEEWQRIARLLFDLGTVIRDGICQQRHQYPHADYSGIHKVTAADTIYEIDRICETRLLDWFRRNWPEAFPALVIAEGLGDEKGVLFPETAASPLITVLIDPIDGTRGLMYDKRSAWMLAGAAPFRGEHSSQPTLNDLRAGTMVEIPTSRQLVADGACAWELPDGTFHAELSRSQGNDLPAVPLVLNPSRATDLRHGFASFASFFPEGRAEIERIETHFLQKHLPEMPSTTPLVFNDQYISSGGQIFELIAGRDRFIADLRPLVFKKMGFSSALTCHPYDLACLPVARASGCIVETPWGRPLASPLDTTSPVSWVGYANDDLANTLRPLLWETLRELHYPED